MEGRIYDVQQQDLLDLQEESGFRSDLNSWPPSDDELSRTLSSLSAAAATGNVDRALFNDLVQMVPLVQSLIVSLDRKESSSFTRRGSMIYTKMPSRESLYKKSSGKSANLAKKHKDRWDKGQNKSGANNQDDGVESFSIFSSRTLFSEKDREELTTLRNQVEDLRKEISKKDELLNTMETLNSEMSSIHRQFDELKVEAAEKESLIKSIQLQLSDAKIELADKQAALEKFQWEAMTSNKKVEELQEDLDNMQGIVSSFVLAIQGLARKDFATPCSDCDEVLHSLNENHELDCEMDMDQLEAARKAYIAAVAAAKEKQDEESIVVAAVARNHLESLLLRQA